MNITRCGSPLGEYEIHCTEKEKNIIQNRIVYETDLSNKQRKTGISCSCCYDCVKFKFYFCLMHRKQIFGEDLKDYELFRTDEDREP